MKHDARAIPDEEAGRSPRSCYGSRVRTGGEREEEKYNNDNKKINISYTFRGFFFFF